MVNLLKGCVEANPGPMFVKNKQWIRIYKHLRGAIRKCDAYKQDCIQYIYQNWYDLNKEELLKFSKNCDRNILRGLFRDVAMMRPRE